MSEFAVNMTEFVCVDDRNHLWQVKDLVTNDQLQDIISLDWTGIDKLPSPGQEFLKRKIGNPRNNDVQRVSFYITNNLYKINQALGTNFQGCNGNFWVDSPGFTIDMHTDGHLCNVMQLYWIVPGTEYGTGFYFYKNKNYLLYQFQSIPNTGYIMLNHLDPDGSQPLHWHGMFNPVPDNCFRLSSYWYFY
jgi:hypothetical protein